MIVLLNLYMPPLPKNEDKNMLKKNPSHLQKYVKGTQEPPERAPKWQSWKNLSNKMIKLLEFCIITQSIK